MSSDRMPQFTLRPSLNERARALQGSLAEFNEERGYRTSLGGLDQLDSNPFLTDEETSQCFETILTQLGNILDGSAWTNTLSNLRSPLAELKSHTAAAKNSALQKQISELNELLEFFSAALGLYRMFDEYCAPGSSSNQVKDKDKHVKTLAILKKITSTFEWTLTKEEKDHLEAQLKRKKAPKGFTKNEEQETFKKNAPLVLATIQKLQVVESPALQARSIDKPKEPPTASQDQDSNRTTRVSISNAGKNARDNNIKTEEEHDDDEDDELEKLAQDLGEATEPSSPHRSQTPDSIFAHHDSPLETVRQAFETACVNNGYIVLPGATPENCVAQVPKTSGDGEGELSYQKIRETTHQLSFTGEARNPYLPIAKVMVEIMILQKMTCVRTNLSKESPEFEKFQEAFGQASSNHPGLRAMAEDEIVLPQPTARVGA